MATIQSAQAKWEEKTPASAAKWKANSGNESEYSAGVARFLGTPPSAAVAGRYRSGVGRVSAEDFASAIRGKGDKWASNTRRGLTGA